MTDHKIGSREEWEAAREELLRREKEHTRMGDELARQRRELPWVPVEKEYRLETEEDTRTLAELFDGRSIRGDAALCVFSSGRAGHHFGPPAPRRLDAKVMPRFERWFSGDK